MQRIVMMSMIFLSPPETHLVGFRTVSTSDCTAHEGAFLGLAKFYKFPDDFVYWPVLAADYYCQ